MPGRLHRLLHRSLIRRAGARIGAVSPRAAIAYGGRIGHLMWECRRGVRPSDVRALLGHLPRPRAEQVARAITVHEFKSRVYLELLRRGGLRHTAALVVLRGADRLAALHRSGRPAILFAGHLGPRSGVVLGIGLTGIPCLVLRDRLAAKPLFPPQIEWLAMDGVGSRLGAGLKRAYECLMANRFVDIHIDGGQGTRQYLTPFLGREARIATGIGVLHRLTGAPLVPVTSQWQAWGSRIEFRVHAPLDVPPEVRGAGREADRLVTEQALRWVEAFLLEHPEQIRYGRLRRYLDAPRLDGRTGC